MEEIKVGEVWKDIKGYEGLYKVSSLGRIKSLKRKVKYQNSSNSSMDISRNNYIN